MRGHAGLAAAGSDIVCAAASVLADNLAAGLERLCGVRLDRQAASGYLQLQIALEDSTPETELLFASAALGLRSVAAEHPLRVQVRTEGD